MSTFFKCLAAFFFLDGTAILVLSLIYGSEWHFDTSSYVTIGIIVLLAYSAGTIVIVHCRQDVKYDTPQEEPPIEQHEMEAFHDVIRREPINYN